MYIRYLVSCRVSRKGMSSGTGSADVPMPKATPKSIPISAPVLSHSTQEGREGGGKG